MKEKNRFSQLLERLMTTADLKNSALAQTLQYDVSYISKWTSGKVLPTEKNAEKIFKEISRYVVSSLTGESRSILYTDYQVNNDGELEQAIYDNLEAEYAYARDRAKVGDGDESQKLAYFPELTLPQFITKMRHPDMRRVKDLEVVAVIDIFQLDHDYRLMIAEIEKRPDVAKLNYPGVHFSMIIHLGEMNGEGTYNAIFLTNLLTNLSSVDFQLYGSDHAAGKIIFTLKGAYAISGMVASGNHCLAVTTCEDQPLCDTLHNRLQTFCTKEALLVRKVEMGELLADHSYVQSLIAQNLQWLLGRMTEHFVPDDLYEELSQVYLRANPTVGGEEMGKIHELTQRVLGSAPIRILIHESAITDFAVSGRIDFYNYKMTLTTQQRLRYMQGMLRLVEENHNLELKLVHGGLLTDYRHIPDPTFFLSNSMCCLRLEREGPTNNISVLNKEVVCDLFRRCFRNIWSDNRLEEVRDREAVLASIRYTIRSIEILDQVERG